MKKLILLFMIFSFNANAAGFIDTLGAQCGDLLIHLDYFDYPSIYDTAKKRNSQFWALQKCLKTYKENGGDIEKLDKRFSLAKIAFDKDFKVCAKKSENSDDTAKCINQILTNFKDNIASGGFAPLFINLDD